SPRSRSRSPRRSTWKIPHRCRSGVDTTVQTKKTRFLPTWCLFRPLPSGPVVVSSPPVQRYSAGAATFQLPEPVDLLQGHRWLAQGSGVFAGALPPAGAARVQRRRAVVGREDEADPVGPDRILRVPGGAAHARGFSPPSIPARIRT